MNKEDTDTSTLAGRILWLVAHTKTSAEWKNIRYDKDFIRVCGLPNLSYISDMRSGNITSPGFHVVWGIIKALEVNPEWIASGTGRAFEEYDREILQLLKKEVDQHRKELRRMAEKTEQLQEVITSSIEAQ